MPTRTLIVIAIVLAAIWIGAAGWLWSAFFVEPAQVPDQAPPQASVQPEPEPEPVKTNPAQPALEDITPARNVTPPDTTPWPTPSGPVERLPADPLPEPPPEPLKPDTLLRVVVEDARTLRAGAETITLGGFQARGADETCTDPGGRRWPCGQAAITELRMLVRGRAIDCDPLPETAPDNTPRRCELSGTDLAEWMLRQGWGEPAADAPDAYRQAYEAARKEQRGAFGNAWGSE
ncbi:MAG: hypothetical protein H6884_07985 [Rhodobiaceae bacterium]|nr:hypothetical protein [Rhodobiaceae bacterium]MCC0053983.1 hypothetical protein [Rhodobiaceae bacterium]